MALLTISNLSKRIGGKWALWDINLEMDFGEIVGIYGRSDSGKTTFARVLAKLDVPTSGTITYGHSENDADYCVSLGMNPPASASELTVYENLDMFACLWGISRRRRIKQISFLLELLDLAGSRSVRASKLSSGALIRLEIARALIADSPVTALDSLLDTLDPQLLEKLWDYLLGLRRDEQKSFLILTSSSKIAETCPRIAIIHNGSIGFSGRPDDFRKLAGEDMIVLGDIANPMLRNRIQDRLSVIIQEEDGFLSFKVANGERMITDLLAEFGQELGCVYLKRPTLDDALNMLSGSQSVVTAASIGE